MKWTLLLIACMLFSCTTNGGRKAYEKRIDTLQFKAFSLLGYPGAVEYFERLNNRLPESLNEAYELLKIVYPDSTINGIEGRRAREKVHFIDVFSRKSEWVGYYPIYDDGDSVIVSYFLLSAGIDGKLDNVLEPGTKLHLDDWKDNLELYNPDEYDDAVVKECPDIEYAMKANLFKVPPYSRKDERSGRKDLLIYVHHLGYL